MPASTARNPLDLAVSMISPTVRANWKRPFPKLSFSSRASCLNRVATVIEVACRYMPSRMPRP